jgi:hypothetical protein
MSQKPLASSLCFCTSAVVYVSGMVVKGVDIGMRRSESVNKRIKVVKAGERNKEFSPWFRRQVGGDLPRSTVTSCTFPGELGKRARERLSEGSCTYHSEAIVNWRVSSGRAMDSNRYCFDLHIHPSIQTNWSLTGRLTSLDGTYLQWGTVTRSLKPMGSSDWEYLVKTCKMLTARMDTSKLYILGIETCAYIYQNWAMLAKIKIQHQLLRTMPFFIQTQETLVLDLLYLFLFL